MLKTQKLSAVDYKRTWSRVRLPEIRKKDPDALYFTIYNRQFRSKNPEVLNISPDQYWCLAASNDWVLLSDHKTIHWTTIASVDRQRRTIDIIDRWPGTISTFQGVRVQAHEPSTGALRGKTLMRLSQGDFSKLFIAAVTLDSTHFQKSLEDLFPIDTWTPELCIALGRSFLYAESMNLVLPIAAQPLLIRGIQSALRAGKHEVAEATVPAAYTALALSEAIHRANGNEDEADRALAALRPIEESYRQTALQRLSADDALRIANAAARSNNTGTAAIFYGRAIKTSPLDYRAYKGRAALAFQVLLSARNTTREAVLGEVRQAREDAESALRLMDEREREFEERRVALQQKRGVYWEKGWSAEAQDLVETEQMRDDRQTATKLRGIYSSVLGDRESAKADGLALIEASAAPLRSVLDRKP
jgi:hypothetical protein